MRGACASPAGSRAPRSVLIPTCSAAPGHGGWREPVPPTPHILMGSIPAPPPFPLLMETWSLPWLKTLEGKSFTAPNPPDLSPSISPSNFCNKTPHRREGTWTCQRPREGSRGSHSNIVPSQGFFLQIKLARDELAPSFIKICRLSPLKRARRGDSAKHGCTDLLKNMVKHHSPIICKSCLVLMHTGTQQRKKSIKYSYFKRLHPVMPSSHPFLPHPLQPQPLRTGNGKAAAGPALPNSTRLQRAPRHRPRYCQRLLVCSWKSVLCIRAALRKAAELSKLGQSPCLGAG